MSTKLKIIISSSIMTIALVIFTYHLFVNDKIKPPFIHGLVIPQSTPISTFSLLDHSNNNFTNSNLKGTWSLLSYGYTHCPDICPTTLGILDQFDSQLKKNLQFTNLQILFYSIDYKRDTVERLAQYIPFFNKNFIGITHQQKSNKSAEIFEKSLGLISILTPIEKPISDSPTTSKISSTAASSTESKVNGSFKAYTVSHGVMLYLINPEGNLQAVFEPLMGRGQVQYFTSEQVYQDYIKLRKYYALLDKQS